jgi:hypothetical protein
MFENVRPDEASMLRYICCGPGGGVSSVGSSCSTGICGCAGSGVRRIS